VKVYAVVVGAFRHLQHVTIGDKKLRANVCITANPSAGPNDGFLTLKAKTPNGSGLAVNAPFIANFGPLYDPDRKLPFPLGAPDSQKMKSAIECIFDQQKKQWEIEHEGEKAMEVDTQQAAETDLAAKKAAEQVAEAGYEGTHCYIPLYRTGLHTIISCFDPAVPSLLSY
jgi:hypothetical protein